MGTTFLDKYSVLHFATGIIAYFLGLSFWAWFLLHGLFELIENQPFAMRFINSHLGWFWPGGKDYADFPINSVGDQISALLGWLLMRVLFGSNT